MRDTKKIFALILIAIGTFYSFVPYRDGVGLFVDATDAEMGILAVMLILSGAIIFFMPSEKEK
jgi:hypothetical protein